MIIERRFRLFSDTLDGIKEAVQWKEIGGWIREGDFFQEVIDQQNRWGQLLYTFIDEHGNRACEIKREGFSFHQLVGLCPNCRQGAIRIAAMDAYLRFECFNTPNYRNPCKGVFHWGNAFAGQIICGIERFNNPGWSEGADLRPLAEQTGYNLGEIIAVEDRKFFVSRLEDC